jgi:hypothetical protein
VTNQNLPSNIPNPDPSVVANERLEEAKVEIRREMSSKHTESRGWVEALQLLHEEKIKSAEDKTTNLDRVVQTRLAGSETALNAAMAAADKVTQEIKLNFGAVLTESKIGTTKQIESLSEKIDDIKDRLNRVEGTNIGTSSNRSDVQNESLLRHHSSQNQIALIAAAIAAAGILIALGSILYTATRPAPAPEVIYTQPAEPRLQHQAFPISPTWGSDLYKIAH